LALKEVVVKNPLDPAELTTALDKVHCTGMPGVFAEVRDGDQVWRGAAGVADVSTGRPVTPDMRLSVLRIRSVRKISDLQSPPSRGLRRVNWAHDPVSSGLSLLVR
jgi:D-alanyl-D-alanine carboxypeptidase